MSKKYARMMLVSVLILMLVLGACAPSQPSAPAAPAQPATPGEPAAGSGDAPDPDQQIRAGVIFAIPNPRMGGGFDRAQMVGLDYLQDVLGWEIVIAEDVPLPQVNDVAASYLDMGFDVVIYTSSAMEGPWLELAPQYPDQWLVVASMASQLPEGTDRAASFFYDFYVYGILQGIVLGLTTQTNEVGVIGGMPIPTTGIMFSGVIEGARAVNPDVNVTINYVGDWVDVPRHREISELMIGNGVDVIFALTGPGQMGVFEAAEANDVWVVGYAHDMWDMAPNAIVTSVLMDTTYKFRALAEGIMSGTLQPSLNELGSEAMGVADFRGSLPAEQEAAIQDAVAAFQRGELEVPRVDHSADFMP